MNRLLVPLMSFLAACTLCLTPAHAQSDPVIEHAPLTAIPAGVPAVVSAVVTPGEGATLQTVEVLVRVTDAGTPVRFEMTGSDGSFSASIPVSVFKGVNVFWYSINAVDSQGRISSTRWIRVMILEGAEASSAAEETALNKKKLYWTGAALLLIGGGVALENHNDDGNDGPVSPPPPPQNNGGSRDDDDEDDTACQTQGKATILNLTQTCPVLGVGPSAVAADNIEVFVCADCAGGDLKIQTTWGDPITIANYNNANCSATPILIGKPSGIVPAGSEKISVFLGTTKIGEAAFPENDCGPIDL